MDQMKQMTRVVSCSEDFKTVNNSLSAGLPKVLLYWFQRVSAQGWHVPVWASKSKCSDLECFCASFREPVFRSNVFLYWFQRGSVQIWRVSVLVSESQCSGLMCFCASFRESVFTTDVYICWFQKVSVLNLCVFVLVSESQCSGLLCFCAGFSEAVFRTDVFVCWFQRASVQDWYVSESWFQSQCSELMCFSAGFREPVFRTDLFLWHLSAQQPAGRSHQWLSRILTWRWTWHQPKYVIFLNSGIIRISFSPLLRDILHHYLYFTFYAVLYCISPFQHWFSNERLLSNERQVKSDCFPNERSKKWAPKKRPVQMSPGAQKTLNLMSTRALIWENTVLCVFAVMYDLNKITLQNLLLSSKSLRMMTYSLITSLQSAILYATIVMKWHVALVILDVSPAVTRVCMIQWWWTRLNICMSRLLVGMGHMLVTTVVCITGRRQVY